jgi:aspartate carbamoyltransferase catalytic subunit
MKHLITTQDLSNEEVLDILRLADLFSDLQSSDLLSGKLVVTLFFENSTRTRSSFEIAAKRLGAEVVNLEVNTSSTKKGESVEDTVLNLVAMKPDAIVIRHSKNGLPATLSTMFNTPILNAGDGKNAHPTQALLDLYTIMKHFNYNVKNKKIAIVGDIATSRVARSNLELLPRFGIEPILVAPKVFMPQEYDFKKVTFLKEVIDEVDIVMSLRTQTERHDSILINLQEYAKDYCITKELFQDKDILLLHPGPVNRNIDISDEMLNDSRCKVLQQVSNGVAIRMAVLKRLLKK